MKPLVVVPPSIQQLTDRASSQNTNSEHHFICLTDRVNASAAAPVPPPIVSPHLSSNSRGRLPLRNNTIMNDEARAAAIIKEVTSNGGIAPDRKLH